VAFAALMVLCPGEFPHPAALGRARSTAELGILTEVWNPISKVRAIKPQVAPPPKCVVPSSRLPAGLKRKEILPDIDDSDTAMNFHGDLSEVLLSAVNTESAILGPPSCQPS
jgi:hypothetical protein